MALTTYGVNHPLARKAWSKRLMHEALYRTWADKFMGEGDTNVIQIKRELEKDTGDRISFGLRMQLSGPGTAGDSTLEGNEEDLGTYADSLMLDQLRHAVRSGGRMSEQRVPFSVRQEALDGLADWWADRIDTAFFNQVCGYTAVTDTRYTGMNAVTAPTASRRVFTEPGATADSDLDATGDTFSLAAIDIAVEKARTASPLIRPVRVNGEEFYVAVIHEYARTDLRQGAGAAQWFDIQKAAMQGGKVNDNPVFNGALGVYNGVIIHASKRVTQGENAGVPDIDVRRNVLLGAQAAVIGFGQGHSGGEQRWVEKFFDYENQLGVSAGMIWGLKKTAFNGVDFATVTISSYAVAH